MPIRAAKPRALSPAEAKASLAETAAAAKMHAAAPSYADLKAAFPAGRLDVGPDGAPVGFAYPKSRDPEKQRRINRKVFELWNPRRKLEVGYGAERNAAIPSETLVDAAGRTHVVPAAHARRKAIKGGMRPRRHYGRASERILYRRAPDGGCERIVLEVR